MISQCLRITGKLCSTRPTRRGVQRGEAHATAGICIHNFLESLFLKEGMNGHLAHAIHRGVQRGEAPLRSFLSPKIGGKGVDDSLEGLPAEAKDKSVMTSVESNRIMLEEVQRCRNSVLRSQD
jgi:hypothetical protein